MHTKTVVILLTAAIAAGAAALLVNRDRGSSAPKSGAVPTSLFPDLKAKVNDVAEIEIKRPGESFTIKRSGGGGDWGLASKSGFPVQLEQVKGVIVGVSQLKPLEAKTANPDLYSKIGVQDPGGGDKPAPPPAPSDNPDEAPPTQPTLVTLKDSGGATLAAVVVGTQKWGNTPSVFVRKAGDKQSWLAEGRLEVPTDAMQWIERQVLNIGRERIKSVSIVHPADGSEVEASREKSTDPAFTVKNVPTGRELTSASAPETIVTGTQYLSIDDVAPIGQEGGVSFSDPAAIAVYHTFDGLVVTARSVKKDTKDWLNLTFSFEEPPPPPAAEPPKEGEPPKPAPPTTKSPDEVKKEVTELTDKLAKWAFAIPEYKAKSFSSKIDDLLKPLTPPTPPGTTPGAPGEQGPFGPTPIPTKPGGN